MVAAGTVALTYLLIINERQFAVHQTFNRGANGVSLRTIENINSHTPKASQWPHPDPTYDDSLYPVFMKKLHRGIAAAVPMSLVLDHRYVLYCSTFHMNYRENFTMAEMTRSDRIKSARMCRWNGNFFRIHSQLHLSLKNVRPDKTESLEYRMKAGRLITI